MDQLGNNVKEVKGNLKVSDALMKQLNDINGVLEKQRNNKLKDLFGDASFNDIITKLNLRSYKDALNTQINKIDETMKGNRYDGSSSISTSKELKNYLQLFTNNDLKTMQDNIRKAGEGVVTGPAAAQLETLVSGISDLSTSKRFYEYKYIMLNIVMLSVLDKLFNALFQFIKDVKDYNAIRSAAQTKSANDLVTLLVQILNKAAPTGINEKELQELDNVNEKMKVLADNIGMWQTELEKRGEAVEQQVFNILNEVRNVDNNILTITNPEAPRSPPAYARQPSYTDSVLMGSVPGTQAPRYSQQSTRYSTDYPQQYSRGRGGFIRSGTRPT